ncbi:MAG: hypothetical protein IKX56_01535 [Muribaculaceae bacterium]|nr:hypothetical protein [Muribaculaceae bacterium]
MKHFLRFIMIAAMLSAGMTIVSCSSDNDEPGEPGRTPEPEIIDEVQEDIVTITAVGEGDVKLYLQATPTSMEHIENPVNYGRDYKDYSVHLAATAQEPGKEISERVVREVIIPKTDEPKLLTVFSTIENENDSTFFRFEFNLYKKSGNICVYKAVFDNDETNFSFGVPVTFDKASGIYRCNGTHITTSFKPNYDNAFDGSTVDNLNCEVNIKSETYKISFDCHDKHFDYSGGFSKTYPVTFVINGNYIVINI